MHWIFFVHKYVGVKNNNYMHILFNDTFSLFTTAGLLHRVGIHTKMAPLKNENADWCSFLLLAKIPLKPKVQHHDHDE